MSNRMWDAIVEHASECLPDGKYYSYTNNEHGNGLIFNSVFDVLQAIFHETHVRTDHLNASQKVCILILKIVFKL